MFHFESLLSSESLSGWLAALAAFASALFAHSSYKVSIQALKIAEAERSDRQSNISAYLADSFRIYNSKTKQWKYIFSIAYSNKSDSDDSITEVYLETFYVNSKDRVSHLISAHEPNSNEWLSGTAMPAALPLNIPTRSSVTGWFVFSALSITANAQRIEKYRVIAKNGTGHEAIVESYIIRGIEYEDNT